MVDMHLLCVKNLSITYAISVLRNDRKHWNILKFSRNNSTSRVNDLSRLTMGLKSVTLEKTMISQIFDSFQLISSEYSQIHYSHFDNEIWADKYVSEIGDKNRHVGDCQQLIVSIYRSGWAFRGKLEIMESFIIKYSWKCHFLTKLWVHWGDLTISTDQSTSYHIFPNFHN